MRVAEICDCAQLCTANASAVANTAVPAMAAHAPSPAGTAGPLGSVATSEQRATVSSWTVARPQAFSEDDQRPRPTIWRAKTNADPSVSSSPAPLPPVLPGPAPPAPRLPNEIVANPAMASAVAAQTGLAGRRRRSTQTTSGTNTTWRPVRKPETAAETSRSPKVWRA